MAVNVDPEHHVTRYCSQQKLNRQVLPPTATPAAFELRAGETYLSVNHCEHHQGARLVQLRAILGDLAAKGFRFALSGGLAVLNAGEIGACGRARDRNLRVRRRHDPNDTSYASVDGLPLDNGDTELLELLAITATIELHLVKDIP